jgi:hypothetical protein
MVSTLFREMGRAKSSEVQKPAGQLFRMAVYSLHRDRSPLGSYLHQMKGKHGNQGASIVESKGMGREFLKCRKVREQFRSLGKAFIRATDGP